MTYLRLLGLISLAAIAGPAFATTAEGTPSQIAPPRTESIAANGLTFSYRMYGPRSGRPILLINGVGMQLVDWPPEFIQGLVTRKFRVIVFDSRDVGQTTHFTAADPPDWPAVFKAMSVGSAPPLAYSVADMATDTAALLEALHTPRADIVGASGGAAIAELLALQHPERVRSLTLLFANSGNPLRRFPADPARASGIPQPTAGETPDQSVERRLQAARALAGRGHPFDEARARRMATIAASRDRDPFGLARQGAAQIALGDVRLRLRSIRAPTVVIHGGDDPLISVDAGRDVADAIPNGRFLVIPGMGHELPVEALPTVLHAMDLQVVPAR